jgi:acyl dehydratase
MPSASDVHVGQQIAPHVIDRVDPLRMKTVAALLDDPVPLHFDIGAVEDLGLGNRLINQGPINVAYLLEMVSRFAGGHDRIRTFVVKLLGSVYEGERVICLGTVVAVDEEAGTATLDLEAQVESRPVLSGSAEISLAS